MSGEVKGKSGECGALEAAGSKHGGKRVRGSAPTLPEGEVRGGLRSDWWVTLTRAESVV